MEMRSVRCSIYIIQRAVCVTKKFELGVEANPEVLSFTVQTKAIGCHCNSSERSVTA